MWVYIHEEAAKRVNYLNGGGDEINFSFGE